MSLLFDDISRVIASPVSRRKMLATVGTMLGGALLAVFGLQSSALADTDEDKKCICPKGQYACHGKCCDDGTPCCGPKCCTSTKAVCLKGGCCETGVVCAGRCCCEDEHCVDGKCRKIISPTQL
jgi:hypothetical protein